jgi:hypothetical protein
VNDERMECEPVQMRIQTSTVKGDARRVLP